LDQPATKPALALSFRSSRRKAQAMNSGNPNEQQQAQKPDQTKGDDDADRVEEIAEERIEEEIEDNANAAR
jgi:hypothetical protein